MAKNPLDIGPRRWSLTFSLPQLFNGSGASATLKIEDIILQLRWGAGTGQVKGGGEHHTCGSHAFC